MAWYEIERLFSDWMRSRYGYSESTLGVIRIFLELTQANEERGFDLFFSDLDLFTGSHMNLLEARSVRAPAGTACQPVSRYVGAALAERPAMYLSWVTVGGLRAFVDGYSLAALDSGHPECADLDGFEDFLRRELGLSGPFRWENVILARVAGDQSSAYQWAVQQIGAFIASESIEKSG